MVQGLVQLTNLEQVQLGEVLHCSNENKCYLGVWRNRPVVVKKAIISRPDSLSKFQEEVAILCRQELDGAIVKPLASVNAPPHYSILLPLMERGSLSDIVANKGPVPFELAVCLGLDIARSISTVHRAGIVHRDIKTANVLVDSQWRAYLTDFGSARPSNERTATEVVIPGKRVKHTVGQPSGGFHKLVMDGTTLGYTAPEIFQNNPATEASDVYGWAITMSEVLTGVPPYQGAEKENADMHTVMDASYSEQALIVAITNEHLRPSLVGCGEQGMPMEILTLVRECWQHDPNARPCAEEIVNRLQRIAQQHNVDTSWGEPRLGISSKCFPSNKSSSALNEGNTSSRSSQSGSSTNDNEDDAMEVDEDRYNAEDVAAVPAWSTSDMDSTKQEDGSIMRFNPDLPVGGFATSGRRGVDKMEDRHSVLHCVLQKVHNLTICTVFDGHGGAKCAEYAVNTLPYMLKDSLLKELNSSESSTTTRAKAVQADFVKTDENFRNDPHTDKSGATAIACCFWWNEMKTKLDVLVANAGDCRAVLCRRMNGVDQAIRLSADLNADNPDEQERIKASGARIIKTQDGKHRVEGYIQVTRSLGDANMKPYGVTACPQVDEYELDPNHHDEFIIVATDGVWDTLSDELAIKAVRDTAKDPSLAAKRVSSEALNLGSTDNISCIVIFLHEFDAVDRIY